MINNLKNNYGPTAQEKWHLFLIDKNSKKPFQIENIGITNPNPNYCVSRDDSNLFVFEYVISGKGYLEVNNRRYELVANDFYVIEPHQRHSLYSDKKDPFTKIWINFKSSLFEFVYNEYDLRNVNVFKNTNAKSLFEELLLIAEKSNYSDDVSLDVSNVLFSMLHILAKQQKETLNTHSYFAKLIKGDLDNALYEKITMEQIADKYHYSKKQINRIFKKEFNDTPYNYYINIKLVMAKRLLKMTSLSIKEISEKLGFDNQYYFSNTFKKKFKMSPLQYKKQL